jgi:metal-dependent HD superfamily phosphatase/phosphodiesterase
VRASFADFAKGLLSPTGLLSAHDRRAKRATAEAIRLFKAAVTEFAHGDNRAFANLATDIEALFAVHFTAVEQESHDDRPASIDVAAKSARR